MQFSKHTDYYPFISLMRGVAALMVCYYHFSHHWDNNGFLFDQNGFVYRSGEHGMLGVYVFFVISGFVIPLSLYKYKYHIRRAFRFLARRWVRLEIPYLMSIGVIFTIFVYYRWLYYNPIPYDTERLLHHVFYTIPLTKLEWYNVIYWTLAVEFQFYLAIALLFPLITSHRKWIQIVALVFFMCLGLFYDGFHFLPRYSSIFAAGMTLFLYKTGKLNIQIVVPLILLSLGICFYVLSYDVVIAAIISLLLIAFVHADLLAGRFLGNISYSLYLTHGAVGGTFLQFVSDYTDGFALKLLALFSGIIVSIVFARVFWWIVEKPSQFWSRKIAIEKK